MPAGKIDTMTDYLGQILRLLSDAKIVADADLPFILELEQKVVGKLRDPITRMQQAGIMPGEQPQAQDPMQMLGQAGGGGGQGGGMPPGGGGPSIAPVPMQGGGLSAGTGAPNLPPELLRQLSGQ